MRVNIYIRKEDEDKWNAIDDKGEWLHFHLNSGYKVIKQNADGSGQVFNVLDTVMPTTLEEGNDPNSPAYSASIRPNIKAVTLDKSVYLMNGIDPIQKINLEPTAQTDEFAEATNAGGLPCCSKRTPCQHWQWNGDVEAYINTRTGEEKVE